MNSFQNADWHLLFGLMALQNGLVTREQLVAAFSKWTADKSSTLDELLVADGALKANAAKALIELVKLQVKHNDDNLQKTLVSLAGSDVATAKDELLKLDDASLEKSIGALPNKPVQETWASWVGETTGTGGRFRILRPLPGAKGGMGEISVAQDEELGRQVALKQILTEKADNEAYRQKFQVEAEITGNLEHPGIVPIYGLGVGTDGRPFYAMRLVHGDNLSAQISNFNTALVNGKVDYNSVEFHGLVDRLIDVAQAVSYAHSRGVLHRDLKPGNVLVGEYGETLVIDWGLARLPQDDVPESSTPSNLDSKAPLSVRSGSNVDATLQGQVLGTVGYAPPEQLNGRVDLITERSDVYGLGAILYQILLGSTPVSTTDSEVDQVIKDAIAGRITDPNKERRSVPKALSAVCMKALAREPADRYASVDEFIAELERWKADQAVHAARESAVDRIARLSRRYRAATLAAAAALMGIAVVAGVALFFVNRARVNEAQARNRAEQLAAEKSKLAEEKTELANRNQTVVDAFVAAFRSADPENEGVTNKMTALDVLEQALDEIEKDEMLAKDELAKAQLLNAIGHSLHALGAFNKSIPAFEETLRLRESQLGSDHPDTIESMNDLAAAYDEAGRLKEGLSLCQKALERARTALGPENPVTRQSMYALAGAFESAGRFDEAVSLCEESLKWHKSEDGESHPHTLATMNNLGYAYYSAGRLDDAIKMFEEAFRGRQETLGEDHPDTLNSMINLAALYDVSERLDEALELLERALPLHQAKLGEDHPDTLVCVNNLAAAYQDAGRSEEALQLLEEVYRRNKATLGADHPKTLAFMSNVAYCYEEANRNDEAVALYEESLQIHKKKFGDEHPATLKVVYELGLAHYGAGRLEEAERWTEQAYQGRKKVLGVDHPDTLRNLSNLTALYRKLGKLEKALSLTEETVKLRKAKLGEDHADTLYSMSNLAQLYSAADRMKESLALYEETLPKQYATRGPAHADTIKTREAFQTALTKAKRYDRAILNAEDWLQALRAEETANPTMIAQAQSALAEAQLGIGNYTAALVTIKKALDSNSLQDIYVHRARSILGATLAAQEKFEEAELLLVESAEAFEAATKKLKPQSRWYRGLVFQRVIDMYESWGKAEQAEEWRQMLADLQPREDEATAEPPK